MQKKLLAVAVTGALSAIAAPAALAQNATVNVYGNLVAEYAAMRHGNRALTTNTNPLFAGVGDPYRNTDGWQNPGSAIGFRGEEKLGGGLSAWFQCETTMDYRGANNATTGANSSLAQGLCNRDSAFGVKGAFGNIFMGNWGTPFKRVTNDLVGAEDTGVFGAGRILYGTSSTYGSGAPVGTVTTANGPIPGTTTGTSLGDTRLGPGAWRRRQSNLLAYDTPKFNGFTGMAAVTTGNMATGATQSQLKSRLWSLGGQYANGPLALGIAYERHNDFYASGGATANAAAPAQAVPVSVANTTLITNGNIGTAFSSSPCPITTPGSQAIGGINAASAAAAGTLPVAAVIENRANCIGTQESAWVLSGSYTFSNNLKVGAQYSRQTSQNTAFQTDMKVNTFMIGMDWMISGPHGIRANYARAGDVSGGLTAAGLAGTVANPLRPTASAVSGYSNTGVQQWSIRYVHMLSKRTEMTLGYVRVDNKANANYELGGANNAVFPGSDSSAVAFGMKHRF